MKNTSKKQTVIILGAGKIGSLITGLLASCGDYDVVLGTSNIADANVIVKKYQLSNVKAVQINAQNAAEIDQLFGQQSYSAVISSLPYYCNPVVADNAAKYNINYFDLTEDVEVTRHVKKVSQGQSTVFMPQCGLAPGFISIAANSLMEHFDEIETVKMRVGALPVNQNNALKYSLTWSTDGLINEYGNPCFGIENSVETKLLPLEGLESTSLDGVVYEAFNTSGGLGTLAETYLGSVKTMNYKTLRYPGHCEEIKLLMNDLKLNDDRDTLKRILENAIPKTKQDVVLIYVSVTGKKDGGLFEENMVRKIYPQEIIDDLWSSIQVTTAAGICAVVDIVLNNRDQYQGFVTQESIPLEKFLENRFGQYYENQQ